MMLLVMSETQSLDRQVSFFEEHPLLSPPVFALTISH